MKKYGTVPKVLPNAAMMITRKIFNVPCEAKNHENGKTSSLGIGGIIFSAKVARSTPRYPIF